MTSIDYRRQTFIDSARGISIILVVAWHAFDEALFFNGPLVFLRMPLFFFMSGLFASALLNAPMSKVIKEKIGQLLWIYVLWTVILYFSRSGLEQLVKSRSIDLHPVYSMFWNPPSTIWFIYALAIAYLVVLLTRSMPRVLVMGFAVVLYIWSVTYGDWANPPFYLKVPRLLPAFILAVWYGKSIISLSENWSAAWPAFALVYVFSAYVVYYSELALVGPVTATVSAFGIFFILTACYRYRETAALRLMAIVGERSIYVFLMHRIVLSYTNEVAAILRVQQYWAVQVTAFALSIVIPATIGMYVIEKFMPWLVSAPWVKRRTKTLPYVVKPDAA